MSLYDELVSTEAYKKLFEQLPNDRKYQMQEDMKRYMDDIEKNLVKPMKDLIEKMPKE